MRMFNRRKVGDTLPGSSATREERQAHNLVISPVYKSVWAWFDSIPHRCKTSSVTAWWGSLEMEPKSLMQHLYCQETAAESYIKCIMCTARVGKYIGKAYQEPKFVKLEALLWRSQRHRVSPSYLKDYSLFAASLFYLFFFFFLFTSMSNLGKSSHHKMLPTKNGVWVLNSVCHLRLKGT